jgi:uncharacterized protein (UPF0333 family)
MQKKRGQAALEFLTTYGWAIMLLLVMVGTLSYFGILNIESFIPEKCTFTPGINCKDTMATNGPPGPPAREINMILINSLGKTVRILDVNVECVDDVECDPPLPGTYYNLDYEINSGISTSIWKRDEMRELRITPSSELTEKVKIRVTINYQSVDEYFPKNISGEAIIKVVD